MLPLVMGETLSKVSGYSKSLEVSAAVPCDREKMPINDNVMPLSLDVRHCHSLQCHAIMCTRTLRCATHCSQYPMLLYPPED